MMELPTIRWCDRHNVPWEGPEPAVGCIEGARVVLPVDFDERIKAQGLQVEHDHRDKDGHPIDCVLVEDGAADPVTTHDRWVTDWRPVEGE